MKNKFTIFIIQENVTLNSPIVRTLKSKFDDQILVFSDLKEIEKALDYSNPSLLIIDIDFSNVRTRDKVLNLINFNVPSIVLSSENSKGFAVGLLKKGAVDYIHKIKNQYLDDLVISLKEVTIIIELRLNLNHQKTEQLENLKNALIISGCTFILIVVVVVFVKWFS